MCVLCVLSGFHTCEVISNMLPHRCWSEPAPQLMYDVALEFTGSPGPETVRVSIRWHTLVYRSNVAVVFVSCVSFELMLMLLCTAVC